MQFRVIVLLPVLLMVAVQTLARGTYQEPQAFVQQAFQGDVPSATMLWLTEDLQASIGKILGHPYDGLRLRYWRRDGRTVWILEEIGKEKAITTGIIVNQNRIEEVKVLIFRESRGWEVRNAFFTDQFKNAALKADTRLDRHIDGISGATLSVRALTKLARLALFLHQHTEADHVPS